MSQLDFKVFTATMASGATTSTEIDLGRSYRKVYLSIPASSVGNTEVWGAPSVGGTMQAHHVSAATGSIASAVSNMMVDLDDYGYSRHVVVVATTAPANGSIYKFVCVD